MDTLQILCTLRNVKSFLDFYASDLLPRSITKTCTVIVKADHHTKGGSHWLAVHFRPKSSYAYYFDSYGIVPFVPDIVDFVQRNSTTWDHNKKTTAKPDKLRLRQVLLSVRPVHGPGLHSPAIRGALRKTCRPTGGGDVCGRIRG